MEWRFGKKNKKRVKEFEQRFFALIRLISPSVERERFEGSSVVEHISLISYSIAKSTTSYN